jgi:carbon monoxide dehydrogenase subunit G
MRLKHSFQIAAPLERVWPALTDLPRIAQCLPGAEIAGVRRDGTHHGTFELKLGPTTTTYRGGLRVEEADETTWTTVMLVTGPRRSGQPPAKATITSRAREHEDGTRVDVDADLGGASSLTQLGLIAVAQRASRPLLEEFADRLAGVANSQEGPEAMRGADGTIRRRRPVRSFADRIGGETAGIDAETPHELRRPWLDASVLLGHARALRRLAGYAGARSLWGRWSRVCPHCGARRGEPCRTRSGRPARSPHTSRPGGKR